MEPIQTPAQGFAETGLAPQIVAALTKLDIHTPTPIQAKAIPVARTGVDLMGIAETGTGKTFAFALPIIERFLTNPGKAVIVVPTRELALQVEESIKRVTRQLHAPLRTVCLIGGAPIYRQKQDLRANPRIIVATPGRLWDHLQQKSVNLADTTHVVLDEADRMLDMGFAPQIKRIMETVPAERQTLCFSATMAPEIARLAGAYLKDPTRVEVAKPGVSNAQIRQELCYVRNDEKVSLLNRIIRDHEGLVLVFSRTKHGARKLAERVRDYGHAATEIHSNRSLSQRRQALDGFKAGRYRVLVATDVAARGIDVPNIELVVNYDLPDASEDYVHRIGRTGRAGNTGKAISLATHDQRRLVQSIERLTGHNIAMSAYAAPGSTPPPVISDYRPVGRPVRAPRTTFRPSGQGFNRPAAPASAARPARGGSGSGYGNRRPGGRGRSTATRGSFFGPKYR